MDDQLSEGSEMKLTGEPLKQKIFEALNNAMDSGYEINEWSAELIAQDLSDYDSFFEGYLEPELVPHIVSWLLENPA